MCTPSFRLPVFGFALSVDAWNVRLKQRVTVESPSVSQLSGVFHSRQRKSINVVLVLGGKYLSLSLTLFILFLFCFVRDLFAYDDGKI